MINEGLNRFVKELRSSGLKRYKGKERVISWREKDYLDGAVDAGVVILPTRGCSWGRGSGCTMCGYVYDSAPSKIPKGELMQKFDEAMERLMGVEYLKIFNSGSFFDPRELSQDTARDILSRINGRGIKRVQVESRPEFLKKEVLEAAKEASAAELEIGLGVETTNDRIRRDCINKNASMEDFERAIALCDGMDIPVKAYLLIKPPFLTEGEAVQDAINSGVAVYEAGASRISFNPTNVQRGTLVEYLWKRREYRPPWLWSVVEVLRGASERVDVPVLSHPTAAGKARGAHNCGECDSEVYGRIIDFSITQDPKKLDGVSCSCSEAWLDRLDLEGLAHGVLT